MNPGLKRAPGTLMGLALAGATIVLGGCASGGPNPDNSIIRAKMMVEQADRAGTRNYDAFDLIAAQTKLKEAQEKMKQGDYKSSRHLANEARVDAELALAKTQTAKTKEAETQLNKSLQSLQNEINNKENPSGSSSGEPFGMPN
ncbi:MAG: DUF4398 domain-containing protein [Nitrospiraceae bacterium]|nr:DUF4398 domain-containing protein [Nitrospiraceae bacterium]